VPVAIDPAVIGRIKILQRSSLPPLGGVLSFWSEAREALAVKRREFLTLLGGAATAWPLAARAQQPVMPVIGFLSSRSPVESASVEAAFREGLKEGGYIEGQNLHIAFRWADGQFARLPPLAEALVDLRVAVIVAVGGVNAAFAAKSATATIPIVFVVGVDPVANGLVASLNRPAGNITGVTVMSAELVLKRLELLRELAPKGAAVAMLVNPLSPESTHEIKDVQVAAQTMGLELKMFNASTLNELNTAFAAIAEQRPDALLVGTDPFFLLRREVIGVPAIYPFREFAPSGGLISYGTNIASTYRQAGIYTGRILKGTKPAELPIMLPTKFQMVVNLKTAKVPGLDVPPSLFAFADEVIE
jgi:putative ABC transport system substrate-binding protein